MAMKAGCGGTGKELPIGDETATALDCYGKTTIATAAATISEGSITTDSETTGPEKVAPEASLR